MESILVSACLMGQAVRYDGSDKKSHHRIVQRWMSEGRIVSVCPEVAGGLPIPRPAAEIVGGAGWSVLAGAAKVMDAAAHDVSSAFVQGAQQALAIATKKGIRIAVLKEGSPSCGSSFIYDGTFSGSKLADMGVTAALLQQAGLHVFSENELELADALLQQLEAQAAL